MAFECNHPDLNTNNVFTLNMLIKFIVNDVEADYVFHALRVSI